MMVQPRSSILNFLSILSFLLLIPCAAIAQSGDANNPPLFSVDLAAGIAPVIQDGMAAGDITADRILLADIAPDGSVVFATINPVRIWRLKNGVVNLLAGGGDYDFNFGFPAKQVHLGPILGLVAGTDSVTFLSPAGSVVTVGSSGVVEYQGLTQATCLAGGADGSMYAVSAGLHHRGPGGSWSLVPNTNDLGWCRGITMDADGNAIVAVPTGDRYTAGVLLRVTPNGEKTAVVGQLGSSLADTMQSYQGDGGPAADAGTLYPQNPVMDAAGNLYFTDQQGVSDRTAGSVVLTSPQQGVIRKITPDGTINALPGCRNCSPAGVDSNGTLLVTVDYGIGRPAPGNLFRYANGTMTPVFGPASGNTALTTRLDPNDIAIDAGGTMWVASRNRLVKIDSSGNTSVIPGRAADTTDTNGEPLPSSDFWALHVAVEPSGDILVAGVLPNGAKYSSDATQAAMWRYSPSDDTFENLLVLSPKPTSVDPGLPMTVPPTDHFIVDMAAPSNGSIYFIVATSNPYRGDWSLYALRPDGTTDHLDQYPAKPLFVDAGGTLWVGELHLNANDQVTDKRPFVATASNLRMMGQAIFGDRVLLLDGPPEEPNLVIPNPAQSNPPSGGTGGTTGSGTCGSVTVVNGKIVSTGSGPCPGGGGSFPIQGIGTIALGKSSANFTGYSGRFGGAGGPLLDAKMGFTAITVSADGTFYVADRPNQVIWKLKAQNTFQPLFSQNGIVNAASFQVGGLAPNTFATVFGVFENAQSDTLTATLTDSGGTTRNVTITSGNSSQLNLLIPAETAPGAGKLTITNANAGLSWSQDVTIAGLAPGLFTLAPEPPSLENGFSYYFGIAAGFAIRDLGGGQQDTIPLFLASSDEHHPGTFRANTIQLGEQPLYLSVYGTGFANVGGLEDVTAEVNGVSVPVTFAGPVQGYEGLEQVNIGPLTSDAILADAPDFLKILVQGVASNPVEFDIH